MGGHHTEGSSSPSPSQRADDPASEVNENSDRKVGLRRSFFLGVVVAGVVAAASAAAAFLLFWPDSEPDGPTTEELLMASLDRSEMSPVEIDERLEVAASLCQLDPSILVEIWSQLNPPSLRFQDFVVRNICPEQATLYAQETGRLVTPEVIRERPALAEPAVATKPSSTASLPTTNLSRTSPSTTSLPAAASSATTSLTVPLSTSASETSGR